MSNADTHERVRALSAGRVDVAIVYATDGALRGRDFAVLSDTLGFFPRYDASFVARTDFGKKHPKAIQALGELKLSQNVMTSLNYRVEVSGQTPNMVARDYLRQTGLSGRIANNVEAKKDELVIAVSQDDSLEWEKQEARRATSLSFPDRRVLAKTHSDPFSAVMNGEARLAIVGAERFFRRTEQGLERDERLEAAAVIGTRTLHIVRRKDDTQGALEGRLGAAPSSSGSGMLSDSVLALAQRKVTDRGDAVPLLKKVNAGTLDAALLWVAPNEEIADMTRSGKIRIAPFSNAEIRLQLPYLRPVEIATGTYANDAGIPTLAAQVVIAARNRMAPKGSSGPSAALKKTSAPLTIAEATALADATETGEAPDPVLPSVWTSGAGAGDQKAQPGSWEAVVDTGLNIAVFAFIAFMGVLLVRREAPR